MESLENIRPNKRLMAYTASAMYGAAALDGLIEGFLPGDPRFSIVPVLVVVVMFVALLAVGPRLPHWGFPLLGPLGVALIAYALATTPGPGDGAVLYALPVLWTTLFFGRRGAIAIIACVGLGHVISLLSLPAASAYPGRWVDVMVSVSAIAVVVLALRGSNELLLTQLADEARTDSLTGLLNRRGFDERATVELAHARRNAGAVALATFDIDYFKHVNDEWGHETGDRVLVRMGVLLVAASRETDVIARLGGEEFSVLLPGSDSAGAEAFTQRVRVALATSDPAGLPSVRISAGVHAAIAPADVQTMMKSADTALYHAKRGGRDQTVAFGTGLRVPDAAGSTSRLRPAAEPRLP